MQYDYIYELCRVRGGAINCDLHTAVHSVDLLFCLSYVFKVRATIEAAGPKMSTSTSSREEEEHCSPVMSCNVCFVALTSSAEG